MRFTLRIRLEEIILSAKVHFGLLYDLITAQASASDRKMNHALGENVFTKGISITFEAL